MSNNRNSVQSVSFTSTETVSLPNNDSLVMAIRSRDWKNLRKSVESLSTGTNKWELLFTVSTTVFLSFLVPAITTTGSLDGWKLIFWGVTLLSLGVALTSLITTVAMRTKRNKDRKDIIDLMDEIQSLYSTDDAEVFSNDKQIKSSQHYINRFEEEDGDYERAKLVAFEFGKMSASLLQRRLRIGYSRAARLVERMEKEGLVSAPDGARPRTVLIGPENDVHK